MITKQSQGARSIAAVMTVLTALLSLGFGCPAVAAPAERPTAAMEAIDAAPCHGSRADAETHDCHGEAGCPRCAGAVIADSAMGEPTVPPPDMPRFPAMAALSETLDNAAPPKAERTPPARTGAPPGSLTPVAFKTVLLN